MHFQIVHVSAPFPLWICPFRPHHYHLPPGKLLTCKIKTRLLSMAPKPFLPILISLRLTQYFFISQAVFVLPLVTVKGNVRELGPCGSNEGLGGMAIWREEEMEMRLKAVRTARYYSNNHERL